MRNWQLRIPNGVPSLKECTSLKVEGKMEFASGWLAVQERKLSCCKNTSGYIILMGMQ